MPFTDGCFLFIQWPDSLNHADDERASGHLEEYVHTIWGGRFSFYPWLSGVFFCPPVNHYLKCFLPDSLVAAGRTSVHQRRDWGPPVCTCQQLRDRRRPAAETRHHSWVRCRPDSYGSSLLPNLEKEKMDKSRLLDYNYGSRYKKIFSRWKNIFTRYNQAIFYVNMLFTSICLEFVHIMRWQQHKHSNVLTGKASS